ncbi:MAG: hypothetical protein VYE27_08805 [Pseudomonadota bacterium]|nr:hypothetical protein [Pseudomonadota bacterium]
MKTTTKQKADLLVENVEQLAILSKLINEKIDKTNQWHGKQNTIIVRFLILIALSSFASSAFLGLIYVNL